MTTIFWHFLGYFFCITYSSVRILSYSAWFGEHDGILRKTWHVCMKLPKILYILLEKGNRELYKYRYIVKRGVIGVEGEC